MGEVKIKTITDDTVRSVVRKANELNLTKEDIIEIISFKNQVHLIYQIKA